MAIITLTTDFGLNNFLPASIKGLVLSALPGATCVDVSHQLTPYNYNQAAYVFGNSFRHFPPHTYHFVFFNLFDTADTKLLMIYDQGQYIIVPDNGLLTMILHQPPELAVTLPIPKSELGKSLSWAKAALQAVAQVENGVSLLAIGKEIEGLVTKTSLRPKVEADYIDANVIYIDAFENVVVNLTEQEFEIARQGRGFTILVKGDELITRICTHYAQVAEGSSLALFNSAGNLEIAVNKGNAAGLFGLRAFAGKASSGFMESRMFYQTVRILFD